MLEAMSVGMAIVTSDVGAVGVLPPSNGKAAGSSVDFKMFTNYAHFIERAEVRVFESGQSLRSEPLAVIEIELMLRQVSGNTVVLHRTYRAEQPALDVTMDATVDAFDQALAALFARFASELAASPTDCPTRRR